MTLFDNNSLMGEYLLMLYEKSEDNNRMFLINNLEGSNNIECGELVTIHDLPMDGNSMDANVLKVYFFNKEFYVKEDFTENATLGYTKDLTIMYWSKAAENLLGYTRNEILGKNISWIVPENEITAVKIIIEKLEQGKLIKGYESIRIHKDGRVIPVGITVTPLYKINGEFHGIFVLYRDLSERTKLQEQLETAEQLWRSAIQCGKFGVWEWQIDTDLFLFHNQWYQLLGLDDQWKNEKTLLEWSKLIYEKDLPQLQTTLMDTLQGQEFIVEFRMLKTNGQFIWVRGKGKVTQWDAEGKPLKMVGTNEDITDRKVIEEQLAEKCRQLEIAKKEAEQANIAKTKFLSSMSHEIRTPMNGIIGIIHLLSKTKIDLKQQKWLSMLKESVDSQMSIINNMLDITKIEAGKIEPENTLFNIKMISNEIFDQLCILCQPKRLETKISIDPEIKHMVIGDKIRIKQILLNLINNAAKFTDHGYITMDVNLLHTDEAMQRIEFKIIDTGIGISDQDKDKIFDSYYQGDLNSKKKHMGTGLGLSISKQLALLMDGDIYVDSTFGEGSTFRYVCNLKKYKKSVIPNENEDIEFGADQHQSELSYDRSVFQNKIVLSIEDNEINQEIIEATVKNSGFHILNAYNGKEALRLLEIYQVDLILMDIQLPEMSGYELTRLIRKDVRFRDTPIIAMTAFAMEEDRRRSLDSGMDDFITKPIEFDRLYHVCYKLLSEKCKIY